MWWKFSTCLLLSICLLVGCNNKDDNSTAVPQPPVASPDSTAAHPTTQQLLAGQRTTLDVKFAPVSLQVPQGWAVKSYSDGEVVTIEGPTPTDVVGISVPGYRTITIDQEKSLEAHAKQDFIEHPELLQKPGVRDIPSGKVIERLIVDPIIPTTQAGIATSEPIQTMQWTFTVCVPSSNGKEFNAYDLRFLGMTLTQYKADQAFLRSIMDTLSYTPATDTLTK